MEDEVDDKIIYQTYMSHMRLLSKFQWGTTHLSFFTTTNHLWRSFKLHLIFRPEVVIVIALILLVYIYLQAVDQWSRGLFLKLQSTLNRHRQRVDLSYFPSSSNNRGDSWSSRVSHTAAFAVQGPRARMEDRYAIYETIPKTDIKLYAVFDGHGGDLASNYAKDTLVSNLCSKIVNVLDFKSNGGIIPTRDEDDETLVNNNNPKTESKVVRKPSLRKSSSTTSDDTLMNITPDADILKKFVQNRPITKNSVGPVVSSELPIIPISTYVDKNGAIDYTKLLNDEILFADHNLLKVAQKTRNVAGTTALIAVLDGTRLVVANVGDSRAVMCDARGTVIPLSFDHKPQQMREQKRIREAGGTVIFNGVWRVAGILATSRALGDYPLKTKKLVIATPDVLTFDLIDHRPMFIILATDGLWDTFSNEEAVNFIRQNFDEPDFGAKRIVKEALIRGSLDNITVIVINLTNLTYT